MAVINELLRTLGSMVGDLLERRELELSGRKGRVPVRLLDASWCCG